MSITISGAILWVVNQLSVWSGVTPFTSQDYQGTVHVVVFIGALIMVWWGRVRKGDIYWWGGRKPV